MGSANKDPTLTQALTDSSFAYQYWSKIWSPESKKLNMKNMWVVYIGTFLIAFAFSAPFFLFLRERRIIELEKIN